MYVIGDSGFASNTIDVKYIDELSDISGDGIFVVCYSLLTFQCELMQDQ